MILHVKLDAAYLIIPGDFSSIDGHYYLSCHPTKATNPSYVKRNGQILTECKTLQNVVIYEEESNKGGIFINGQHIAPI